MSSSLWIRSRPQTMPLSREQKPLVYIGFFQFSFQPFVISIYCFIVEPSRKNAKKDASAKEVLVSLKSRQKHKYITIITGLDLYGNLCSYGSDCVDIKIKEACKFFCKKFSCSVSSEKNHSGIQEIHIQGDVKDDVADLMNETYDV